MKTYATAAEVPELAEAPTYRKKVLTRAVRIKGPFRVLTSEGPLTCTDGYLALDAHGYLYPIARQEFEMIYIPEET